jgi:hypothetical protein
MRSLQAVLLLIGSFAISNGEIRRGLGGKVDVHVESSKPWEIILGQQGEIDKRFLSFKYTFLGELDGNREVVPNVGSGFPADYHSVPLDLLSPFIAPNVYTSETNDYAFIGFGQRNIPQTRTNNVDAYMINFVAKRDFNANSWPLVINNVPTTICFVGKNADGSCKPHQIRAGTVKSSFGGYHWSWASNAVYWRVQFTVTTTGFQSTVPLVMETADSISLNLRDTATDNFRFDLRISKSFNRGDNTFGQGQANVTASGNTAVINVDIPRAELVNNGADWWLYDPEIDVPAAQNSGTGGTGSTSAATTATSSVSTVSSVIVIALALLKLAHL